MSLAFTSLARLLFEARPKKSAGYLPTGRTHRSTSSTKGTNEQQTGTNSATHNQRGHCWLSTFSRDPVFLCQNYTVCFHDFPILPQFPKRTTTKEILSNIWKLIREYTQNGIQRFNISGYKLKQNYSFYLLLGTSSWLSCCLWNFLMNIF